MNENFVVLDRPFRTVENGRIHSNECAITDNQGACLMYGELDTMRSDYEAGQSKWTQPTSAQVYRDQK